MHQAKQKTTGPCILIFQACSVILNQTVYTLPSHIQKHDSVNAYFLSISKIYIHIIWSTMFCLYMTITSVSHIILSHQPVPSTPFSELFSLLPPSTLIQGTNMTCLFCHEVKMYPLWTAQPRSSHPSFTRSWTGQCQSAQSPLLSGRAQSAIPCCATGTWGRVGRWCVVPWSLPSWQWRRRQKTWCRRSTWLSPPSLAPPAQQNTQEITISNILCSQTLISHIYHRCFNDCTLLRICVCFVNALHISDNPSWTHFYLCVRIPSRVYELTTSVTILSEHTPTCIFERDLWTHSTSVTVLPERILTGLSIKKKLKLCGVTKCSYDKGFRLQGRGKRNLD